MIIFIDESGDPGLKLNKGSTKFFVLVMVIFEDYKSIETTSIAIDRFRKLESIKKSYEFKFNKLSKQLRIKALNATLGCNYRIRALVINKQSLSKRSKKSNDFGYSYFLSTFFRKNLDVIANAKITIDGSIDHKFKKATHAFIRNEVKKSKSGNNFELKFVDSKSSNLVQLADLISGSIYKKCQNEKGDSSDYYEILKERIDDIQYIESI